jgi:hypothetical protein
MEQQLKDQAIELNDLRRRAPPKAPDLRTIADGTDITLQQFAALNQAQANGAFDRTKELKRVSLRDPTTGRVVHHFFGNERAAWDGFCITPEKRVRINGRAK